MYMCMYMYMYMYVYIYIYIYICASLGEAAACRCTAGVCERIRDFAGLTILFEHFIMQCVPWLPAVARLSGLGPILSD